MTDYKNIFGKPVKFLATDPDNAEAEGQIWYNSTADAFKDVIVNKAWSSASPLISNRNGVGGFGVQTAALAAGSGSNTEEYNGSGWTTGGSLNTSRPNVQGNAWGIQTAGIVASGSNPPTSNVEEYDGTSWTEVNNVSTARRQSATIGLLQTAGALCGGYNGTANVDITEEYDGTNWTAGGSLNTARRGFTGAGTLTQGIVAAGVTTTVVANTEEYDGTSWTNATSMNTARNNLAGSKNSPQTSFIVFGGTTTAAVSNTEEYDGTSWTEIADLAASQSSMGGAGTASGALSFGGGNPSPSSVTEEYNRSVNVITPGAWASGGNMNTARATGGDCGTYLAGLIFGGNIGTAPYATNVTEEYNGSTWSSGGNTAQDSSDVSGAGTQTAGLAFGFSSSPNTITQHYDGSTWTTVPGTLPTQQNQARGIGTQTAAISVGYSSPGTGSFEYDGSTWTAGGTTNNSRSGQKPGGWGIQTAAIIASGYQTPPATIISNTETYDGTTWTETGHSVITAVKRTAATTAGTSSDGMLNGGGDNAGNNDKTAVTQKYNGTAWFTQPSLATAKLNQQGFGTSANAVVAGGDAPGGISATTEEFTAETSALNIKTISTS